VLALGGVTPKGMQLSIPNADIPKEAAFLLEERTKVSEWAVFYCPNIEAKPPTQAEIARFSIREGGLWCQWTEPFADAAIREQLSNGHLAIKAGDQERRISLRPPRQAPRIVIDLSKPTDVRTFDLGALPRDSAIAIQLLGLEGFTRGAQWKKDAAVLALGKKATIEFKEVEGALIDLAFAKRADDTLVITLKPIFIEQSQPTEMTTKRLVALEASLPGTITEAKRDLQDATSQHSSLQSELQSLKSRQPASLAEVNALNVQLKSLEGKVKGRATRISQLQRRIQKLEAQRASVPEAKRFLAELHQKASIRFNIVAAGMTENDPLILVRGTDNPQTPVDP
jgi:hypothetical protein